MVAPARERGLKLILPVFLFLVFCRSREGAWIEISEVQRYNEGGCGRSREGAWIEIIYEKFGNGVFIESLPRGSVD